MIISDVDKYVFVELPRTGSSAVSRELRRHYHGRSILHKHATYEEFLRSASDEQKGYFVFGGIRNPLDDAVSLYFKLLTDHKSAYSDLGKSGWLTRMLYSFRGRQFRYARGERADFSRFFLRFYRWPYDNWSCLSHARFDCLLRFESLAEDFARAVAGFGATAARPLPVANKTAERAMHFSEYYDAAAIARAKRVFGMYMARWNYAFPESWGPEGTEPGAFNRFLFHFLNFFRRFYWRFLRPAVYAITVSDRSKHRKAREVESS